MARFTRPRSQLLLTALGMLLLATLLLTPHSIRALSSSTTTTISFDEDDEEAPRPHQRRRRNLEKERQRTLRSSLGQVGSASCEPVGECRRCAPEADNPREESEPWCKDTGHRQELLCVVSEQAIAGDNQQITTTSKVKYESCIPAQENDFIEFLVYMVLFSIASLWIVRLRKRAAEAKMAALVMGGNV